MPKTGSEPKRMPGWRFLTWVMLVGSLIVVILQSLRRWPFDGLAYVSVAGFGFLAIHSAYLLIRNVRLDA
jgi:hypothetical protein